MRVKCDGGAVWVKRTSVFRFMKRDVSPQARSASTIAG